MNWPSRFIYSASLLFVSALTISLIAALVVKYA